ncbi:MAG: porin family protein [Alistipes sp.]|jgi:hypothetical protein|nr:porin family protein [Alistipes sp.]MDR2883059.1 porin family protein [Alistipes sp.]
MKKAIFTILLLAGLAGSTQAQDKKFWVGGSVGFSSTELSSVASGSSLTILPEFGYNLSERWAVGLRFGLNQAELDTGITISDFQEFSIAPFARYTLLTWKALSVFADGGIAYSDFTGDTDFEDNNTAEDTHLSSAGIFVNPGFSLRLSGRFALTGSVNLFHADYTQHSLTAKGDKTKTYSASLNSPFNFDSIQLGFNFRF